MKGKYKGPGRGARSSSRLRIITGGRLGAAVLGVMLVGAIPVLAATVDITIPIDTIVRGEAGSQHVLRSVDVPVESRGETCQATAVARNQDSEHPDSDLLISSATSVEILDVENQAYGAVFSGGLITLGESITVTLTLGPDRVFSAGLDVEIDCPPFTPPTTTTTTDSSSSSVDDTSTASSQPGDTTVSSQPGDTTVSSQPGDTTDGADGSGGTTGVTTRVLDTTITAPGASVSGSSETLPFTGVAEGNMGGVAFALVALGGLVVLSVRRRETEAIIAQEWRPRVDFYDISF